MPLNRRIPFFNINKSQLAYDTLRRTKDEIKQRSNSQKPYGAQLFDDENEDDKMTSDKLFHTICVGSSLSHSLGNPCSTNVNWAQIEETIINLFKYQGQLGPGELREIHENISLLLNSNFGTFVFERLKSQVLPKAVRSLKANISDENYLETLGSVWEVFYHKILSTLECMLHSIERFSNVSIRRTTLVIFRDHLLINSPLEDQIKKSMQNQRHDKMESVIIHMILIVQSVSERYPPSENKLQIEKIAALLISPYVGYYGIYLNYNQTPVIESKEPFNLMHQRPFDKFISQPTTMTMASQSNNRPILPEIQAIKMKEVRRNGRFLLGHFSK